MRLSTKGEYASRAMLELSLRYADGPRERAGIEGDGFPFGRDPLPGSFGLRETCLIQGHIGSPAEALDTIPFRLTVTNKYETCHSSPPRRLKLAHEGHAPCEDRLASELLLNA